MSLSTIDIARVCHEANRVLQLIQGDPGIPVAPPWDAFPEDQQAGVVDGVEAALTGADPEELHVRWVTRKSEEGWVHGLVKDEQAKTHPCIAPYAFLPAEQRIKDALFHSIITALAPLA